MPSVIAIEAKPLEFEDIDSGFFHLYLVKTQTDASGRVISEKVIRGSLEGFDDLGTIAGANLASSPDRRGSDTPPERHRTVLDLGTRNADDVWNVMVQHAVNIDRADLRYSVDIARQVPGDDLNSNSVIASVLHTAGLSVAASLPVDVSRSEAPLYGQLQFMKWTIRYRERRTVTASRAASATTRFEAGGRRLGLGREWRRPSLWQFGQRQSFRWERQRPAV